MEIKEAQQLVDEWINTIGGGYFSPLTNMALLAEETGEVARIIARRYGEQVPKPGEASVELADELADVLRVVICLANQTGIDLEEALNRNLDKIRTRDARRFK